MKCCVSGCNSEATYVRIMQISDHVFMADRDGYEQWCVEHVYTAESIYLTKVVTTEVYELRKVKERL